MNSAEIISRHLEGHLAAAGKLSTLGSVIEEVAARIISCLEAGNKVLLFGNGGSAADAQHLAAELVVRYRRNRRALPAIALTTDTSILTAGANDFGYEGVFARQIEALARDGDIAIGLSTSGASPNVIAALRAAKDRRCVAIAFTGASGGMCAAAADLAILAPADVTAHVQECHITVGHILCELVETHFIAAD